MIEKLNLWISLYNDYVGGYAILILLIPTGLIFTVYFKFSVSNFGHTLKIVAGQI